MDKIFMTLMVSQAMLDTVFNAYQRRADFAMSDEDLVYFIDFWTIHCFELLRLLRIYQFHKRQVCNASLY